MKVFTYYKDVNFKKQNEIVQLWKKKAGEGWYRTLSYEQDRKDSYVACKESTEEDWQKKDKKVCSI